MMKPRWSPEINFGHMVQAASVFIVVGGGAITSYVSLRADIAEQALRYDRMVAEISTRVAVLESRRRDDERFQSETREQLSKIADGINSLRLDVVNKQDRPR